ncbi:MAG: MFS transporter [Flavobacteriales bacterium]|nr:MFS transporter [Flavobacteriales bacterium]
MLNRGNRKLIRAWTFYDWANSVHSLVITTAIFPLHYSAIAVSRQVNGEKMVNFIGHEFNATSLINYTGSLAFIIICLVLPILTGIADYTDSKKKFLKFFCYLGAASCAGLYFFEYVPLGVGLLLYILGLVGFWGSVVFYNSYLPLIAKPEEHDRVSARGYTMGYLGSVILLLSCILMMIYDPELRPWSFVLTGIWWAGFAQITFRQLPNGERKYDGKSNLLQGYKELRYVWRNMKKTRRLKRYLLAFFVYSMGVQTVMLVAVFFGEEEILWESETSKSLSLMVSVLIIQLIAALGAYIMAWFSSKYGNIRTLILANALWVIICILAVFISLPIHFYLLAILVGFVMGGIQSMSRSTYAKFLPETRDTASFFSFFDVAEKLGIVFGLFIFGFLEEWGNMRLSVLSLLVFFAIGLLLLFRVPREEVELQLDH